MGLFNFKGKESKPAAIIQLLIDYTPEHYRTYIQFKESVEYLEHREWGLALDSLIDLADESGDYFSEEFWSQLGDCYGKNKPVLKYFSPFHQTASLKLST